MTLSCLFPGALASTPPGPVVRRPIGTLLLIPPLPRQLELFAEAVRHWRVSPWCPTVMAVPRGIPAPALGDLRPVGMQVTLIEAIEAPPAPTARSLIRSRPAPDSTDMAAYLIARHSVHFGALYAAVIRGERRTAALRQALREAGQWTPHDLVALDLGVRLIAKATALGWTEAQAAHAGGMDVKTVSALCARYFGRSWRQLVGLGVWEGVVELALRRRESGPYAG